MSEDRKIVLKFKSQASRAVQNYTELVLAVHNKRNEASLEALLAEQLVMSVAVGWESFLTDLLLTYAMLDSKKSMDSLQYRILNSIKDRYGSDAAKSIRFSIGKTLSKIRMAGLLDARGWNLSVKNAESLSQRANDLLAAQFAKKFTLVAEDMVFLDFLIALRNYLAHRSSASRTALKDTAARLEGGSNAALQGVLTNIGPYLRRKGSDGKTRAVVIVTRLIEIAEKL